MDYTEFMARKTFFEQQLNKPKFTNYEYPTGGKLYQFGYRCCQHCKNNPKNNPYSSGICNCILPYKERGQ